MPLRDHFVRSPRGRILDRIHAGWPMVMAADLNRRLPPRYVAGPNIHLGLALEIPDPDLYEVLIEDTEDGGRLVAAVELVSPANKDRPDSRRAFVAKCGSMLLEGICVAVVDLVTVRRVNLYRELLEFLDVTDASVAASPPAIYAAACRCVRNRPAAGLEAWAYPLQIGQDLPTLPLWLDEEQWVPLDLESNYEMTCSQLRLA